VKLVESWFGNTLRIRAVKGGKTRVGSVEAEVTDKKLYVTMLHVAPDSRHQGIAGDLILAIRNRFPDLPMEHGPLTKEAQAFYNSGDQRLL